jgi:hypothetical protein
MAGGSMPAWERAECSGGEISVSPLCQCTNILDSESALPRNRVRRSSQNFPSTHFVNEGKKGKRGIICYVPLFIIFARAAAKSGMVPKVGTPETCSTFSGERRPLR